MVVAIIESRCTILGAQHAWFHGFTSTVFLANIKCAKSTGSVCKLAVNNIFMLYISIHRFVFVEGHKYFHNVQKCFRLFKHPSEMLPVPICFNQICSKSSGLWHLLKMFIVVCFHKKIKLITNIQVTSLNMDFSDKSVYEFIRKIVFMSFLFIINLQF